MHKLLLWSFCPQGRNCLAGGPSISCLMTNETPGPSPTLPDLRPRNTELVCLGQVEKQHWGRGLQIESGCSMNPGSTQGPRLCLWAPSLMSSLGRACSLTVGVTFRQYFGYFLCFVSFCWCHPLAEGSGRITAELLNVQYTVAQKTVKNNFKAFLYSVPPPTRGLFIALSICEMQKEIQRD